MFTAFCNCFCETCLVTTPFFLGDSLIFATGALTVSNSLNLLTLFVVLCLAAIAGDTINCQIGHLLRKKVENHENIRFIKQEHLDRTHIFFEKYGVKTIIMPTLFL